MANRTAAFVVMMLGEYDRREGKLASASARYRQADEMHKHSPLIAPQFRGMLSGFEAHVAIAEGRLADAGLLVTDGIKGAMLGKDMPVIAQIAVACVALRAALDQPEFAAETLGAADSLRGSPDLSNGDAVSLGEQLRARLGDAAYDAAYGRGRALSRADALALVDPAYEPDLTPGGDKT
jgi:hypothetical protein